jgi:hypothetical protein
MSPQSKNEAAIDILKWLAYYRALARLTSLRVADPRSGRSFHPTDLEVFNDELRLFSPIKK